MSDERQPDFYSASEAGKVLGLGIRRVQQLASSGELVGERHGGSWRLARWSVHQYLEEHGPGRPRVSRLSDAPGRPESVREALERVSALERELGRLEGRLELTERAESSVREERDRLLRERDEERRRADKLQQRLEEEREQRPRGFWSHLFGGKG